MCQTTSSLRLRLESRLVELGLSKSGLCRKIKRSPRWLSDVLAGRHGLTERGLQDLCRGLDVPLSFFAPEIVRRLTASAHGQH